MEHADGRHIVRAHDSCWKRLAGEQLLCSLDSTFQRMVPFNYPLRLRSYSAFTERLGECFKTGMREAKPARARNKCDVSVPQCSEMLHTLADSVMIIDFQYAD